MDNKEEVTLEGFIEKLQEVVFSINSEPIKGILLEKSATWTPGESEAYRIGLNDALEIILRRAREYSEKKI